MDYDRFAILMRDSFQCGYCKEKLIGEDFEIDHLFPRSWGGTDNLENLVAACQRCNRRKKNRLFMPYIDVEEQIDELFGTHSTWYVHRRFGDWALKFTPSGGFVLEYQDWYFIEWERAYESDWVEHISQKKWGRDSLPFLCAGLSYMRNMILPPEERRKAKTQRQRRKASKSKVKV